MFSRIPIFAAAAALLSLATPAAATIIGGGVTGGTAVGAGGVFVKLTVPFASSPADTVGNDNFQTPNLYGFDEDQNIVITSTIAVNIGTSPVTGDTVASHYVFFDPGPNTSQQGYVDFDADIYGVATSTSTLAASDFLANTGVTYLNPGARGLEPGDSVAIDPANPKRLLVNWVASTPGNYVRVFTKFSVFADIPEPATLALFGLGLAGFGVLRRRKNA